ncbi:hypothetical protein F0562_006663 [Nyssa sinensis]|uniref:Uncharacterized protein n=1 Tax=Nyssa sinensis TaxID=561372 RepID=A0A5J5AQW8_9ASTE|nr:hypothetical protein F0562_006663 [Nyssa sinensis]
MDCTGLKSPMCRKEITPAHEGRSCVHVQPSAQMKTRHCESDWGADNSSEDSREREDSLATRTVVEDSDWEAKRSSDSGSDQHQLAAGGAYGEEDSLALQKNTEGQIPLRELPSNDLVLGKEGCGGISREVVAVSSEQGGDNPLMCEPLAVAFPESSGMNEEGRREQKRIVVSKWMLRRIKAIGRNLRLPCYGYEDRFLGLITEMMENSGMGGLPVQRIKLHKELSADKLRREMRNLESSINYAMRKGEEGSPEEESCPTIQESK